LLAIVSLVLVALESAAQVPPRSISTPKEEVDDEFLAYIHGIVMHDATLRIRGERLRRDFPEFASDSHTPFHDIALFSRTRVGGRPRLTIRFTVPLDYEVPVDILGHHPVELFGSSVISFAESRPDLRGGDFDQLDALADTDAVVLFTLVSGYMRVDVARWLDVVSGALLEDVNVRMIALVHYEDEWYAVLGGFSPKKRPMVGILNMRKTRFVVIPPRDLAELARRLVESTR
jgi:hypothetical protein